MPYKVRIIPIIPIIEVWKGPFLTADEAWDWVEQNNNPFVDYEVVAVDETESRPPQG